MNIELIYFEGCPNVDVARESLRKACSALGVKADWKEWDQNDDNIPDHAKDFGSPSILVDGKDIAGGPGDCCQQKTCRIYKDGQNAPNVEIIKSALQQGLHS
jgi:mercuric ion transport protein